LRYLGLRDRGKRRYAQKVKGGGKGGQDRPFGLESRSMWRNVYVASITFANGQHLKQGTYPRKNRGGAKSGERGGKIKNHAKTERKSDEGGGQGFP